MKLSVIIPAYNESERLPATLESAGDWLDAHLPGNYEIVVIDDGSNDATSKVVMTWMEKNSNIHLLQQEFNQGKGAAVRRGMLEASGDIRIFMDADHSTHVSEVEKVFTALDQGADVVIASRQHPDSNIEAHQSWLREHMGKGFNLILRSIIGLPMEDTQCGFKAFTAEASRRIFAEAKLDGFSFDVEAIYLAVKLGYRIAEIPVKWANEPNSKVRLLTDPARMFADVIRIRAMHLNINQSDE